MLKKANCWDQVRDCFTHEIIRVQKFCLKKTRNVDTEQLETRTRVAQTWPDLPRWKRGIVSRSGAKNEETPMTVEPLYLKKKRKRGRGRFVSLLRHFHHSRFRQRRPQELGVRLVDGLLDCQPTCQLTCQPTWLSTHFPQRGERLELGNSDQTCPDLPSFAQTCPDVWARKVVADRGTIPLFHDTDRSKTVSKCTAQLFRYQNMTTHGAVGLRKSQTSRPRLLQTVRPPPPEVVGVNPSDLPLSKA